jgi:hypothetical protein
MRELPESNGGWMEDPLALLRRERDRSRAIRRRAAFVCAALALGTAPPGLASSLEPDSPSTPVSAGLQPDAFRAAAPTPAASAPAPAPAAAPEPTANVLPVRGTAALPPLGKTVAPARVEKPTAPKVTQVTPTTPAPVTPAPVTSPVVPRPVTHVVTTHVALHRHAALPVLPETVRHRVVLDLGVPATLHGSVRTPAILRAPVTAVVAASRRRELVPAALALLALVATSGCLLAVAARVRRDGAEV